MDHNIAVSMRTWMNDPSLNNRHLHELAIPGTHDSGTFPLDDSGFENGISKTQTHDIAAQLEAGIRYFDIRVNADNMTINHSRTATNYPLADILRAFKTFLAATRETVIMQVKHEWGATAGFHDKMIAALKAVFPEGTGDWANHVDVEPMRLHNNAIPVMSQLRGKLVYVRRYGVDDHEFIRVDQQDGATSGIPVDSFVLGTEYNAWSKSPQGKTWQQFFDSHGQESWPDNKGNYDVADTDFRNRHGLSFVVQDWYSINIVHGVSYEAQCKSKIDVVKLYHDAALEKSKDSWFLNFINVTQAAYQPREYAVGPNRCNARLYAMLLNDKRRGQRGTYLLDFYEEPAGLVKAIVDMNFS
jgi:hypothetical protein